MSPSQCRKLDGERAPGPKLGPNRYGSAVGAHDVAHDRQAQPGASRGPTARPIDPVEALENPRLVGLTDTDPLVFDFDEHPVAFRPPPAPHGSTVAGDGGVLDGVVEQVADGRCELLEAPGDTHIGARHLADQRNTGFGGAHPFRLRSHSEHIGDNDGDLYETMTRSQLLADFRATAADATRGCIVLERPDLLKAVADRHETRDTTIRKTAFAELEAMDARPSQHAPGSEIPEENWFYRFAKKHWFFGFGAYT